MFSSLQRLQQSTNHAISVLMAITLFIALSSYVQLYFNGFSSIPISIESPVTSHTWRTSRTFGSVLREKKENIKFDKLSLDVDLTPLFNYNTKQVFVYLTYEYPGYNELSNSKITFWDKIIKDTKEAKINLKEARGKYSCWDYGSKENFTSYDGALKLEWNIQPYVGALIWGETKGGIEVIL